MLGILCETLGLSVLVANAWYIRYWLWYYLDSHIAEATWNFLMSTDNSVGTILESSSSPNLVAVRPIK